MRVSDALGRFGEQLAAQHLMAAGMEVLDRNWRCSIGEIDIVARDGDTLVICEVKTRRSLTFGHPVAAVTPIKLRRLRRLAAEWASTSGIRARTIRLDVVGILTPRDGQPIIEHIRGVS
ncbi:MAG: YraN family protein [Actinobacteria bacterium]|jgi:putative endonuclease|nr:YraN family protein [Actinomycetota bacterium]